MVPLAPRFGGPESTILSTMNEMTCAVYIMTNAHRTVFYTGVTSDIGERVMQHKAGVHASAFTKKYNVYRLIYYELTNDIRTAIAREKQIKGWRRSKKVALIEALNPEWKDLAAEWDWRWSLDP
jgi:putative endonuclease